MPSVSEHPHVGQPVLRYGCAPIEGRLTVILVHGRGGSADDMIHLARELHVQDLAYLAPQAAGRTWYANSFLAPLESNEPGLSSGLQLLASLVERLGLDGVAAHRVGLVGFSQGGCLALEFAARNARRWAAVAGLSAGLIGPPGIERRYPGSFDGAPVFLGCSDEDPHIPLERVHQTAEVFKRMGATVDERIYPGMGHLVNREEIEAVRTLLR